jgi:hypothetical protein
MKKPQVKNLLALSLSLSLWMARDFSCSFDILHGAHSTKKCDILNAKMSVTYLCFVCGEQDSGRGRMFKPFLRQFFVRASDPGHVKVTL